MDGKRPHFSDFLKDVRFIRWQLTPDDRLNAYWEDFVRENPHAAKDIRLAAEYLKTTGLNDSRLSDSEKERLLEKIRQTAARNKKRTEMRRFIRYGIAASVLIAGLVFGGRYVAESLKSVSENKEIIVGNQLHSEHIRLITGGKDVSFQDNIEVEVTKEGVAKITQQGQTESESVAFVKNSLNKLLVPFGKRTQLNLPDGSKLWLNSGTALEFSSSFARDSRDIRLLSGEIYIEVAPDARKPFFVHTSGFGIKVLGTKFNVSAYEQMPETVVLAEGSVSLHPNSVGNAPTMLTPGKQAVYGSDGTFALHTVDVNRFTSWKDGYLILNDTPILEVLEKISRYYNFSFNYAGNVNLHKRTCTGKIYLSENPDNVMTTVALLSSTTYEREGNTMYITNKKH